MLLKGPDQQRLANVLDNEKACVHHLLTLVGHLLRLRSKTHVGCDVDVDVVDMLTSWSECRL